MWLRQTFVIWLTLAVVYDMFAVVSPLRLLIDVPNLFFFWVSEKKSNIEWRNTLLVINAVFDVINIMFLVV